MSNPPIIVLRIANVDLVVLDVSSLSLLEERGGSICMESLIKLRVAFYAINARRLPHALLVYTLVRPPMTTSVVNNSVFRGFFEKQKLTGPNFIDWYRQLRFVLSVKDKLDYLEQLIPPAPVPTQAGIKNSVCSTSRAGTSSDHERLSFLQIGRREICHWNRNCPHYLSELLKNKKLSQGASGSGIFTLKLYTFYNKYWVYDTGCGTHICNTTQGLRGSKKLKLGPLSLYVGNGQRAAVEAIETYHLCLPIGLVIVLNNCHYAPSITRGIISVSRLYDDGYVNRFVDNAISISRNNLVYFSVVPRDGIFEIDLSNSNTIDSSMCAVSNKRAKLNLDSALLWHYRLGHISKKRIKKLQHDGLLNSTDLRAFGKCVSCMSRKMAQKSYTHQVERDKDLLRLIHTDVCGPFRTVSRQGASYFVTFTDDFSRYGYVYLLKHKHEVSSKGTWIIAHRTPPYTPQHNGVSERRNRTLLDMVRSMMSQTTLPKFFWDYALETAAYILNMVPTKKVEKTPYEVWHGQAPKLIPKGNNGLFFLLPTREQKEDAHPSINTSLHHKEDNLEIDEPQSDIIPIRRSTRTRHAPDRMCLYIDAEEHELGDLGEPANYKAALLDLESDKWLSKTDMDGAVHTYKVRLVVKRYTQTPRVNNEETFSPVADIRAIRILVAIAAFHDYEI
ncbi:retrotransposon protein, putative, ty1-copia subclass [Tanacetum coccineum]